MNRKQKKLHDRAMSLFVDPNYLKDWYVKPPAEVVDPIVFAQDQMRLDGWNNTITVDVSYRCTMEEALGK